MSALPLLTASRQACARRCQREHRYRYGLGYRPVQEAGALRFGTLVHRALEAWWRAPTGRLTAALAAMAGESDAFELAKATALVLGYDARWLDEVEQYEVLGVEVPFETQLVNPETGAASRTWLLAGKLDLLLRNRSTGDVEIWDHKTASGDISVGSDYYKRLRIDAQISTYYSGAVALGHQAGSFVYDVIAKPGQRPLKKSAEIKLKKDGTPYANQRLEDETADQYRDRIVEAIAENPGAYFQRARVVRLEKEIEEAAFDTWQLAVQLREAERAGRFARNPDACVRYGATCPFFSVCVGEASIDDRSLFTQADDVHPELTVAAEQAA